MYSKFKYDDYIIPLQKYHALPWPSFPAPPTSCIRIGLSFSFPGRKQ